MPHQRTEDVRAHRREMAGVYLLDRSISHENADLAEAAAIEAVAPTKCAACRPWIPYPKPTSLDSPCCSTW